MSGRFLTSKTGLVSLDRKLGEGGEGAVFEVAGQPTLVAKVYHEPPSVQKGRKLHGMAEASSPPLAAVSAWPQDVLMERGGRVRGLLMPAVRGHREIHDLYGPSSRKAEFPDADFRFLVHVATNVARAFTVIHTQGHVVGDINHSGVLVSKTGTVQLIDCDSFQVRVGGETHRCLVGVPDFTPPELQGTSFETVDRTADHDGFGLAVLTFLLLFVGRHPYVGRYKGPGDMPIEKAIRERLFAFDETSERRGMVPPPATPTLRSIPPALATLFQRAFGTGARPSAKEWIFALETFSKSLRACKRVSVHKHWTGGPCPWCAIESRSGIAFFVSTSVAAPAPRRESAPFDEGAAWAAIRRVAPPRFSVTAPPLTAPLVPSSQVRVLQVAMSKKIEARRTQVAEVVSVALGVLLIGVGVTLALGQGLYLGLLLPLIGGLVMLRGRDWGVFRPPTVLIPVPRSTRQAVRLIADGVKRCEDAVGAAEASARGYGPHAFRDQMSELEDVRSKFSGLSQKHRAELRRADADAAKEVVQQALRKRGVRGCGVEGIGPAKTQRLISSGVYTAADVTKRKVEGVQGIGSVLASRLVQWRQDVERKAKLGAPTRASAARISQINDRFATERAGYESALRSGPAKLAEAANRDRAEYERLMQQWNDAVRALQQTKVDLDHAQRATR